MLSVVRHRLIVGRSVERFAQPHRLNLAELCQLYRISGTHSHRIVLRTPFRAVQPRRRQAVRNACRRDDHRGSVVGRRRAPPPNGPIAKSEIYEKNKKPIIKSIKFNYVNDGVLMVYVAPQCTHASHHINVLAHVRQDLYTRYM